MFFFFNVTSTTEIYTLSLHDALPIWILGDYPESENPLHKHFEWRADRRLSTIYGRHPAGTDYRLIVDAPPVQIDRKSTRLNSSHTVISYAVFCLKKKKIIETNRCQHH